jgi:hypothetical protein
MPADEGIVEARRGGLADKRDAVDAAGGKRRKVCHRSVSGGLMMVCSGLSGLAAAPAIPSGSAAIGEVSSNSRRLA